MAVSNQTPRNVSIAAPGATVFPYDFKITVASDMLVMVDGVEKVLNVDYTLDGVASDSGGDITFSAPLAGGESVLRKRNMAYARDTDFQALGDLHSATLNNDQDAPVLMIQQLSADLALAVTLPDSYDGLVDLRLPPPESSKLIGWNYGATALQNWDPNAGGAGDLTLRANLADVTGGTDLVTVHPQDTGAVERTLSDKINEHVSVLDFIPPSQYAAIKARTSTYDCLASINAAIAAVAARGGGEVYFPPGLYPVSDTVVIEADCVILRGTGRHYERQSVQAIRDSAKSAIIWAGASSPAALTCVVKIQAHQGGAVAHGNGIKNLGIDGNMQAPVGLGIYGNFYGMFDNVSVFACTEACYDMSAPRYALGAGYIGASQFNTFRNLGAINYVYDGGTGAYYDNTCKGMRLRQDMTIEANGGAPESNVFQSCKFLTSKGTPYWIESIGQNMYQWCHGAAMHPAGPELGYNCVLGSTDQDSNPGIALWGKNRGVARLSLFLLCEMSIVAKASTSATGGGSFGCMVIGKSVGNVSPEPTVEKGAAGSSPARLQYMTLGFKATQPRSTARLGEFTELVREQEGSPTQAGPVLYLKNEVDTGAAGQKGGKIQWRQTNSNRVNDFDAGSIEAEVISAASGTSGILRVNSKYDTSSAEASCMEFSNGVTVPITPLLFKGRGTMNLGSDLYINNTRVLTSRQTGWTAATGTAARTTFATSTVTLEQLANRMKALIDDLIAHGLIG